MFAVYFCLVQHICEVKKPRGRLATPHAALAYATGVTVRVAQAFAGAMSHALAVEPEEEAEALYEHLLEELGLLKLDCRAGLLPFDL